jgi:lipopolysaccharide transport system ATP-binding protein
MSLPVRFEHVHKEYPFYQHMTAGFKSFLFSLPKNISSFKKTRFVALKDVSFEIRKGETFGIIGRNASGKSTILSLIAGVIRQDKGNIDIDGTISSLLELGAGFHPDLSGLENIILNGVLMGNTKADMLKKVDSIISFAELGDFIFQPLRTYSSGMQVRLGFSVAVHIEPEILLVDEALAVGDLGFQKKCMKKMLEFKRSGATIIFVSHDMGPVARLCDRVAWLDSGTVMSIGRPLDIIRNYVSFTGQNANVSLIEESPVSDKQEEVTGAATDKSDVSSNAKISWWDNPVVLAACEARITGSPDMSFFDYLKKYHIPDSLERGLNIGTGLKSLQPNFVSFDICRSFDVIENEQTIESLSAGTEKLPQDSYDLILCSNTLHRIGRPEAFLKALAGTIKDNGLFIAFEYVGPAGFQHSAKELNIAGMLYHLIMHTSISLDGVTLKSLYSDQLNTPDVQKVELNKTIDVIKQSFTVMSIKYFGGPLLDLVLNEVLGKIEEGNERDYSLISAIVNIDDILVREGVLGHDYAMIVSKRNPLDEVTYHRE